MSDEIIERIEAPRAATRLVGHETAAHTLADAWQAGRMAHGWLLAGPPGIGKATLAWRFVKFLQSGGRPGGQGGADDPLACDPADRNIRQILAGAHPDVRLVRRSANPRPPHRLRTEISVEDVRALGAFMNHTAAGAWRCVVVDAADEMNLNAQNALLKLLEEPPARTLLLLVCHAPSRLLPTVRSRCRTLLLRPLAEAQVADVLAAQRPELAPDDVALLARLAEGAPGRAVELADAGGLDLYRDLVGLLDSLPDLDGQRLHKTADKLSGVAAENAYRTFTGLLQWWLGRMIRSAASGAQEVEEVVPGEATLARRLAADGLEPWLKAWENTRELLVRGDSVNLDRKQVLMTAFFDLAAAARS